MEKIRSKEYLKFIHTLPCVITGREGEGVHAHHLIGHGESIMGGKSCDLLAFPLWHEIHTELHNHGWKRWEEKYGSQWEYAATTMRQYICQEMFDDD